MNIEASLFLNLHVYKAYFDYSKRKCKENVKIDGQYIYHKVGDRGLRYNDQWRLCIKTIEEKNQVLASCQLI